MKVENILMMNEIINDDTIIVIRPDDEFYVLASGNWYHDDILGYSESKVTGFTWEDENNVYIDIV